MAKYLGSEIEYKGRFWLVLEVREHLECFYVQEVGRNFKCLIPYGD